MVGGVANLHGHADGDEALVHVQTAEVGGKEARADEHQDERGDEEAVVDDARRLLDLSTVLRRRRVRLRLLGLHGKRAHCAQLLDDLVRVCDDALGHLAPALVQPVHSRDEELLHEDDQGDGRDAEPEQLRTHAVDCVAIREDHQEVVQHVHRKVKALGREVGRVVVEALLYDSARVHVKEDGVLAQDALEHLYLDSVREAARHACCERTRGEVREHAQGELCKCSQEDGLELADPHGARVDAVEQRGDRVPRGSADRRVECHQ
mmetsp:Transcript_42974/g.112896  ORF Transcript_42974/g.112896 Transcript_42974/m.112896 type:complete len:264 (-) Transcript_42974:143-934(-)